MTVTAAWGDTPHGRLLSRFWPPERQILLLIAALGPRQEAAAAWRKWNQLCTLNEATSPEVRLLASIARRMPELDPDFPLLPRLQGARRFIYTRTQLTLATARPLLKALSDAGLRLMLIKGAVHIADDASLAAERALRDVDVLVHPEDISAALAIVEQLGWTARLANPWAVDGSSAEQFPVFHAIGLSAPNPNANGILDLHHFASKMCRNVGDDAGLWSRARKTTLMGMELLAPSMTDSVLITLAHSHLHSSGSKTADWALDIEPTLRKKDIDWDGFLVEARQRRLEAFLAAPLILAADRLGMTIPTTVITELTSTLDETFLNEFVRLASGSGNRSETSDALIDATREAAIVRANHAARREGLLKGGGRSCGPRPKIEFTRSLGPREFAHFELPELDDPDEQLDLEVSFVYSSTSDTPEVVVKCQGLILKVCRLPKLWTSLQRLVRRPIKIRRRLVVQVPATLFLARRIARIGVAPGAKTRITALELRWLQTKRKRDWWEKIGGLSMPRIGALDT